MLTLTQDYPYHCPICGSEHTLTTQMFACGHFIESYHDAESQKLLEEMYPEQPFVSLEFCESQAQVVIYASDNQTTWYFAENKILDDLYSAIPQLVKDKGGISYTIYSHKMNWELGQATISLKIDIDNETFWIGSIKNVK